MAWLHKRSSRSYLGRPVRRAVIILAGLCVATCVAFRRESAEAIVGAEVTMKRQRWLETSSENKKAGRITPLKGQTHRGKRDLICSIPRVFTLLLHANSTLSVISKNKLTVTIGYNALRSNHTFRIFQF